MSENIQKFTRQRMECDECGESQLVDTIYDKETNRFYWICKDCDAGVVGGDV